MSQNLFYPPSGSGAANASVGVNSSPIPGSSTLVGGNSAGTLIPLSVDALGKLNVNISSIVPITGTVTANQGTPNSAANRWPVQLTDGTNLSSVSAAGALKVDGSAVTQPISAASLPLPTGASTSALQTSGNSSLSSIDGKLNSLGQKASAASMPVVIASDQSAVPVSGSVTVSGTVSATQGTSPWVENLTQVGGSALSLGQKTSANSIPMVLSSDQSAIPVTQSGTWTVGLSAGANTIGKVDQGTGGASAWKVDGSAVTQPVSGTVTANQGTSPWVNNITQIGGSALSLGQKTMANSVPVVISSDQSAISAKAATPTAGTVTQAAITVGTSAVRLTVSGSAPSASRSVLVATPDSASTAKFYIGSSSVTSSGANRGVQITSSQIFTANSDAGDYYIISDTAAQTVYVMEQA